MLLNKKLTLQNPLHSKSYHSKKNLGTYNRFYQSKKQQRERLCPTVCSYDSDKLFPDYLLTNFFLTSNKRFMKSRKQFIDTC